MLKPYTLTCVTEWEKTCVAEIFGLTAGRHTAGFFGARRRKFAPDERCWASDSEGSRA